MLQLYFGNIKNIISTILLGGFFYTFVSTITQPSENVEWKKMNIFLLILGFLLSATSGIKDYGTSKPVISFESPNVPLILLSVLGVIAILCGIVAIIVKNVNVHKVLFYLVSGIAIVKIGVVEVLRIIDHYSK